MATPGYRTSYPSDVSSSPYFSRKMARCDSPSLSRESPTFAARTCRRHTLAPLAHVGGATRFNRTFDARGFDRLDLVRDASQRLNRFAVEILITDDDGPAAVDPLIGTFDRLAEAIGKKVQDDRVIDRLPNHHIARPLLLADPTQFSVEVSAGLDPVVHGDEGVVRIAHDGDQMRRNLVDDIAELRLVPAVLVKDGVVGKATFADEPIKLFDVCVGRVFAEDSFQIVDLAQQTFEPRIPHLWGR